MIKRFLTPALLMAFPALLFGQTEKEITSSIRNITIYTQGAQIENEATVALQKGHMVLKFTGLSPYIKKESIRIEGDGSFTIQNVQHQNDFVNELEKNKETAAIRAKIEELQDKIEYEQTLINILIDKSDFLKTNKEVTGKEQAISPDVFNSLNSIYGSNIEYLALEKLKKERTLKEYNKEVNKLNNQLNYLNNRIDLPSGTIIVSIDARQSKTSKITFSYLVENARWYPSYDIRFTGIDKPLTVTYKANIRQNTGVDWKDVNIVLSTSKTNISAQIPTLSPFYLQYYYPVHDVGSALQGRVSGVRISQSPGEIRADNMIRIRGAASPDGKNNPLYVVDGIPRDDISYLNPEEIGSIEVLKDASATALYGSRGSDGVILVTTKSRDNNPEEETASLPLTVTSRREISNEYSVETPQTITSDDKISTIIFKESKFNSTFEYQTIPMLTEHVFLIGRIIDWYKTDLLDGEANIYLENSYVGKSVINTRQFKDTLDISFGVDNNIGVKRERLTNFTESQLIGMNRKVTVAYKLTLRNNKAYPVIVKVFDQIPVTTIKEIQVETLDISGGSLNSYTGKVEWDEELPANGVKELIIKYSVRYPKDKNVIVE